MLTWWAASRSVCFMRLFMPTPVTWRWKQESRCFGLQAASDWLYSVPWGLRKLLVWLHERYGGPDIVVTENGCDGPGEDSTPLPGRSA